MPGNRIGVFKGARADFATAPAGGGAGAVNPLAGNTFAPPHRWGVRAKPGARPTRPR